jgi:Methyltransferase domain
MYRSAARIALRAAMKRLSCFADNTQTMLKRRWRLIALTIVLAIAAVAVTNRAIQRGWADTIVHEWRFAGVEFQCNICSRTFGRFDQGAHTSNELQCPFCQSRPRHRTAYRYFRERSDLFDGRPKRMLHIAPEPSLGPIFRAVPNIDYLSGDLDPQAAMVQMDITDIQYPDSSFDVVYCSHVLEHVPDDRKAIRELVRVLTDRGWAVIAVPMVRQDRTFEDPSITTAAEREKTYGQSDHVRAYGPDFVDRLRESGCNLTIDDFARTFTDEEVRRHGLSREDIYVCRKKPVT